MKPITLPAKVNISHIQPIPSHAQERHQALRISENGDTLIIVRGGATYQLVAKNWRIV